MGTFVVTSRHPDPRIEEALQREYPGSYYQVSPMVAFLTASGTAQEVALKLGVKPKIEGQPPTGLNDIIVVKVASSYWGFFGKDFWDWLAASLERDG